MAREPLNGGGFHLIAGVWNTSAPKHSAAKRVQDCFVEWALLPFSFMVKGMKLAPELLLKLLVGMLPVEKHAARKTVPYEVA